jgi:hypothetical protein
MMDEKIEPENARNLLKGKADVLNSAFHLSYNMVLNNLRIEGVNPEDILHKSFFHFQNNASMNISGGKKKGGGGPPPPLSCFDCPSLCHFFLVISVTFF